MVKICASDEDPAKHLLEYLRKIETEKQKAEADFVSREEMEQFSQRKRKWAGERNPENEKRTEIGETEPEAQKLAKIEKKNRNLKEKLKVCEREREIALNALQQQTEHFNQEQTRRRELEEKVEQLELMLELAKSEKKGSPMNSK